VDATVTLKVKFANFRQITRSRTGQTQIKTRSELEELGNALLESLFPVTKGVRPSRSLTIFTRGGRRLNVRARSA